MIANIICFVAGAATIHFVPKLWDAAIKKFYDLTGKNNSV